LDEESTIGSKPSTNKSKQLLEELCGPIPKVATADVREAHKQITKLQNNLIKRTANSMNVILPKKDGELIDKNGFLQFSMAACVDRQ